MAGICRSVEFRECRDDLGLRLIQGFRRRVAIDVGETEVCEVERREHVHMQMGYFQPGDDDAGSIRTESSAIANRASSVSGTRIKLG